MTPPPKAETKPALEAARAKIVSRHVDKIYPSVRGPVIALKDFSLDVGEGEFVCIVGPSGCGKSTYLRILAGLDTHTGGTVEIRPGEDPTKPLNNVVFQEYAVFPWKTVIENVCFGLQMRGVAKAERLSIAEGWLERVGLRKFAGYYPHQISGGMKQRVSIIRALANDPEVLLMDEPLGALDAQTRLVLQDELLRIWEGTRKTVVYITHSLDEAILLGDRVVLMTAHPGQNLASFEINLPRPRTVETLNMAVFGELRGEIWEKLASEVTRAMEMQG
jgi:NitT/TauT family transport system ATP-binding protein